MRLIVFGCYALVWALGYLAGKYMERRRHRGMFGSMASSGVAQMRAQQFEEACKRGAELGQRREGHSALRFNRETKNLEPFDPNPSSKPWPLDRRTRVR